MQNFKIDKEKISALCKNHGVESLYLFGSAVGNNFTTESDIDFLVKFGGVELSIYFENYLSLKENLEQITGRTVDLVEEQTVRNPVLKQSIDRNKYLVYG